MCGFIRSLREIRGWSLHVGAAGYILLSVSLILIGYRGSGKTTVGRLLGRRLGWAFVDSDDLIVGRAGKTIRQIFAEDGEARFRDLEAQVVAEVAALKDHVIAVGGGALGRKENRAAIQAGEHHVVYLRCHARELLKRIGGDPKTAQSRPHLTALGGGIEEIEQVLAGREPIWREVMSAELDVTDLSPEQAAEAIAAMVRKKN